VLKFSIGDQSSMGSPDPRRNIDCCPLGPMFGGSIKKLMQKGRILAGLQYAIGRRFYD